MTRSRKAVLGSLAVVVLLGMAGLATAKQRSRGPEVRTEEVRRRDLVSTITASGYIQPKRKVDISADISGRVSDLLVEEGDWVEAGAVLLRIDPASYEANVRRATAMVAQAKAQAAQSRASLARAESELARAERLSGAQNLISPAELEQAATQLRVSQAQLEAAEYGVEQAEAGLTEAQDQLRKTTIVAPMSGQVIRVNIEAGETAIVGTMNNPGSLLLSIADLSEMEARVRVGETDIPALTHGNRAELKVDAYPDLLFTGHVTRIANSAVAAPGGAASAPGQQAQAIDFEVIIALDEPSVELRPDLSTTAEIVTATRSEVIAVPIIAVTVRDAEGQRFSAAAQEAAPATSERSEVEGVFVVREGKPSWAPIEIGIVGDWYFEVLAGLEPGDVVISGPYGAVRELADGDPVRFAQTGGAVEAAQ